MSRGALTGHVTRKCPFQFIAITQWQIGMLQNMHIIIDGHDKLPFSFIFLPIITFAYLCWRF
ncbi:hypothetical protein VCR8J2_50008 [Vibrio coralliirubri]|nr:hypothetical protein VCR8J2_50008 [Vibrio coralliirubri]